MRFVGFAFALLVLASSVRAEQQWLTLPPTPEPAAGGAERVRTG
jgi:hypothetical protein